MDKEFKLGHYPDFVTKIKVVNSASVNLRQTVGAGGAEGGVCMQSQFCSSSLKTWLITLAVVLIVVTLALSVAART
jgi:subtilase family serine protease